MTARRAARLLRAAVCAVVLAALIAGLPAALYKLGGNPVPHHLPSWQQVTAALGRRDDGTLFVAAVRDLSWAGWAAFTLSAVLEAAARARGRAAPRLPALGPLQALAATLLTATIAATPAAPALPAMTPALLASRTAATAQPFPRPAATATLTAARTAASPPAQRHDLLHTVVTGDNLWDLARTYLGSGERWHQIYTLNHGRPQPGGGTLTDPARIYPGWRLLIPAPALPHGHGHPPGHRRPAPHRRTPAPSPAATSPSPARTPHQPRGTPATARPGPARHGHPGGVRLPSGALIGLATAAAVSTALAAARIRRRRRYRPGALTSSLEPATQPPPVISALDRAARHPAISAAGPFPRPGTSRADIGTDPELDLDLDLYEPYDPGYRDEPAAPYSGAREAPGPALPSGLPPAGQDGHPPGPGQIPVGIRDGQEITADITALGGLGLTGPGAPAAARAMLAGLLARPLHGPGRAPAGIIIPADAFGQLLPAPAGQQAHPPLRGISVPATLEAALDELEAMIVARARTTDTADGDSLVPAAVVLIAAPEPAAGHRLRSITGAGPDLSTAVILLGDWPHGTTCHIAGDGLITGITPPDTGLAGTRAYHLTAADLGAITAQLGEASGTPGEDSPPAPGPPHLVTAPAGPQPAPAPAASAPGPGQQPATAAITPDDSGGASPVQVSVLGPLQITATGRPVGTGLRKARELLAFLAVRGADGVTGEEISEALWPGAPAGHGARQRHIALWKARELLRGATGLTEPMWITLTADRYRLDPALIDADLWQFQSALETARTAADDQGRLTALRQAVACYRGPLADGAGYDWAEPYAETARRRALDAWARIAEILQTADPEQALTALETALTHDPYNEYTYQQIMRLQAAQGRPDAVRRTLALLENRLGQLNAEPAASTRQLAASLLGTGQPHRDGGGGGKKPSR